MPPLTDLFSFDIITEKETYHLGNMLQIFIKNEVKKKKEFDTSLRHKAPLHAVYRTFNILLDNSCTSLTKAKVVV